MTVLSTRRNIVTHHIITKEAFVRLSAILPLHTHETQNPKDFSLFSCVFLYKVSYEWPNFLYPLAKIIYVYHFFYKTLYRSSSNKKSYKFQIHFLCLVLNCYYIALAYSMDYGLFKLPFGTIMIYSSPRFSLRCHNSKEK